MDNRDALLDMPWLEYLPVSVFSMIMGMSGFAVAWQKASQIWGIADLTWQIIACLTTLFFGIFVFAYSAKALTFYKAVREEWHNPMRIVFFPTISISMMLMSSIWMPIIPAAARDFWEMGVLLHLIFTLVIVSSWIYDKKYSLSHITPAWFIPVVGNLFVPIGGGSFIAKGILWFFFTVGMFFWAILLVLVMYRLFFGEPLPARLMPTHFILMAPPSIGFLAYTTLTGSVDNLALVLYSFSLFFALLLAVNAWRYIKNPFHISAWAYSFPLAAITISSLTMAGMTGHEMYFWLGGAFLTITTLVVISLFTRTLIAFDCKEICVPE